jgi:hypothetical protein
MNKTTWTKIYLIFTVIALALSNLSSIFHDMTIIFVALSFINAIIMIRMASIRTKLKSKLINNKWELILLIFTITQILSGIYNNYIATGIFDNLIHFKKSESFANVWNHIFGIVVALFIVLISIAVSIEIRKVLILKEQKEVEEDSFLFDFSSSIENEWFYLIMLDIRSQHSAYLRTTKKARCVPLV